MLDNQVMYVIQQLEQERALWRRKGVGAFAAEWPTGNHRRRRALSMGGRTRNRFRSH